MAMLRKDEISPQLDIISNCDTQKVTFLLRFLTFTQYLVYII